MAFSNNSDSYIKDIDDDYRGEICNDNDSMHNKNLNDLFNHRHNSFDSDNMLNSQPDSDNNLEQNLYSDDENKKEDEDTQIIVKDNKENGDEDNILPSDFQPVEVNKKNYKKTEREKKKDENRISDDVTKSKTKEIFRTKKLGRKKNRNREEKDIIEGRDKGEKTKYNGQNLRMKYKREIINETTSLSNKLAKQNGFKNTLYKINAKIIRKTSKKDNKDFLESTVEDFLKQELCDEHKGKGEQEKQRSNEDFFKEVREKKNKDMNDLMGKKFRDLVDIFNGKKNDDNPIFKDFKLTEYINSLKKKGETEDYINAFKEKAKDYNNFHLQKKNEN